jgi:hypothetical protein
MDDIEVLQKLLKIVSEYCDTFQGTKVVTLSMLMRMIERAIEELEDEAEQPEHPGDPF